MLPAALLLGAPAAAAPAVAAPVLGVTTTVRRHGALTGRRVRVRGRLAQCQPRSCGLLDDERLAAPVAWLSFAPAPAFDRAAGALVGRRVVVEGVVLDRCWPAGRRPDVAVCADRAAQFRPDRIVGVLPDAVAAR